VIERRLQLVMNDKSRVVVSCGVVGPSTGDDNREEDGWNGKWSLGVVSGVTESMGERHSGVPWCSSHTGHAVPSSLGAAGTAS
jgi:hypothetical protein